MDIATTARNSRIISDMILVFNKENPTYRMILCDDSMEGAYHLRCKDLRTGQVYGWKTFSSVDEIRNFLANTDWY